MQHVQAEKKGSQDGALVLFLVSKEQGKQQRLFYKITPECSIIWTIHFGFCLLYMSINKCTAWKGKEVVKNKTKTKHKLTNFTTGEACKTTDILKTPPCIQIDHRG